MRKFLLTRNVTRKECEWLKRTFKKGETVFEFIGTTYGCISYTGIACSIDGEEPFFELPFDAISNEDGTPVLSMYMRFKN